MLASQAIVGIQHPLHRGQLMQASRLAPDAVYLKSQKFFRFERFRITDPKRAPEVYVLRQRRRVTSPTGFLYLRGHPLGDGGYGKLAIVVRTEPVSPSAEPVS